MGFPYGSPCIRDAGSYITSAGVETFFADPPLLLPASPTQPISVVPDAAACQVQCNEGDRVALRFTVLFDYYGVPTE
jgi:hypothetical protein